MIVVCAVDGWVGGWMDGWMAGWVGGWSVGRCGVVWGCLSFDSACVCSPGPQLAPDCGSAPREWNSRASAALVKASMF